MLPDHVAFVGRAKAQGPPAKPLPRPIGNAPAASDLQAASFRPSNTFQKVCPKGVTNF